MIGKLLGWYFGGVGTIGEVMKLLIMLLQVVNIIRLIALSTSFNISPTIPKVKIESVLRQRLLTICTVLHVLSNFYYYKQFKITYS
jgi:hypothetical protein